MNEFKFSARSHFDFTGLGELKARAQNNDKKVAKEVGSQFVALFVQMMLKSMREAGAPLKSDLLGSSTTDTFEQMYHGELSQQIARRSSLGIGDWILKNMNSDHSSEGKAQTEHSNLESKSRSKTIDAAMYFNRKLDM